MTRADCIAVVVIAAVGPHPPVGRRFIISLCLFIGGFLLSLRGWENTDNSRRFVSTAQILCGLGISGFGLVLWLITFSRWSWDWWL